MIGRAALTIAMTGLLLVPVVPASAEGCGEGADIEACTTGTGGFGAGGAQGPENGSTGGSSSGGGGGQPVSLSPTYVESTFVPTCSGNSPEGGLDALCGAAAMSCPVEGEIRFWEYRRTVTRATRAVTDWELVTEPPSVCLGPDEPRIDPVVLIPGIVQRQFEEVVVLKGVAEVSPRPDTLVKIPTVFTTSSPESYPIPLTILERSVVITATAERWTWHFGDGKTGTTTRKGTAGRVEHEYVQPGSRGAYVVIEWSGTFTIDGGAPQPIAGTATTTGDPVAVEVKEARSELVAD